jgi:hypothetical protein
MAAPLVRWSRYRAVTLIELWPRSLEISVTVRPARSRLTA